MPIYVYRCANCGDDREEIRTIGDTAGPECCGTTMIRVPTCQAMVKMKGEGGYPSRRKQIAGSAPYTSIKGGENDPAFNPKETVTA